MLILGLASLEVIGIAWVYGTNVVTRDFNFMFETELSVYWRICWGFICPLLLPGLFIYLVFVDGGPFVGRGYCSVVEANNGNLWVHVGRGRASPCSRPPSVHYHSRRARGEVLGAPVEHYQGRSVRWETVRSISAKQLMGAEQHQGENRLAGVF